MKLFVFIVSFLITFNVNAQDSTQVVNIKDLFCVIEHQITICTDKKFIPYTGIAYEEYENGKLKSKREYKDGKLDGWSAEYHINGQLEVSEWYSNGILKGASYRKKVKNNKLFWSE